MSTQHLIKCNGTQVNNTANILWKAYFLEYGIWLLKLFYKKRYQCPIDPTRQYVRCSTICIRKCSYVFILGRCVDYIDAFSGYIYVKHGYWLYCIIGIIISKIELSVITFPILLLTICLMSETRYII